MYTIEKGVLKQYIPESGEMKVILPEGITRIAEYAFSDAPRLRTISLPESLEEIDNFAFYSSGGHLETIYIPDGVKKIAKGAFMDCTELKTVSISENLVPLTNEGLDSIFSFTAGKTLLLIVRMNNGSDRKMVISCGQYGSVVFSPINQDICESYDHLLAAGKIKLNRINEEGRLRGMIWRLQDEQWPVKEETVPLFAEFLAEKVNKAIALAINDNEASYIQILCSIGAINADNSARIRKKLVSSKMPMFEAMADQLDKMINAAASGAQETVYSSPEEDKCAKWMKDNKGDKILLGLGIEQIEPVYYVDGKTIAPKLLVKFVIASLIAYPNEEYYEDEWIEGLKRRQHLYRPAMALRDTNEIACLLDHDSLLRAIKILYDNADRKRQAELCKPLFRFVDGKTVQAIYNQFRKTWYETAVINAIELSDSREAMMLAEKCKVLKRYAELRGTTEDDIRDTRIFEYGLDEKGHKEYDLGSKRIIAQLQKDLSIQLTDVETGKTVKSIPKKNVDPEKAKQAADDYAELKTTVKKVAKFRSLLLFSDFLSGNGTDPKRWENLYFGNPVLKQIARTIVWEQGDNTFVMIEDGLVDENGKVYNLIADEPVCVAHPMNMTEKQVASWRDYFVKEGIKQPFRQVWEPVLRKEDLKPERYRNCMIPFYRFKDKEKHGITVHDNDFHYDIEILFDGCKAIIERIDYEQNVKNRFEIKEITFREYTRQVNHIFVYLDQITIMERIVRDDEQIVQILDTLNVAQIADCIRVATENESVHATAILLEYWNRVYPDYPDRYELVL